MSEAPALWVLTVAAMMSPTTVACTLKLGAKQTVPCLSCVPQVFCRGTRTWLTPSLPQPLMPPAFSIIQVF